MKIYYDKLHADNFLDIDQYVKYKKPPAWYENLTPYWDNYKTFSDLVKNNWSNIFQYSSYKMHTVKTCPGINTFFRKSLQLKLDNDLLVETGADGGWVYTYLGENFSMSNHAPKEAPGLSDKHIFLKFSYNFAFQFSKDCDVSFIDPVLIEEQPYRVCPGIIQTQKQNIMTVSVITLFPKVNKKYHFPRGSTLACMQFSEKVDDLVEKDLQKEIKKHFYNSQLRNNNQKYFTRK